MALQRVNPQLAVPEVQVNGTTTSPSAALTVPSKTLNNRLEILKSILSGSGNEDQANIGAVSYTNNPEGTRKGNSSPLPPSKVRDEKDVTEEDLFEQAYFDTLHNLDPRLNEKSFYNLQLRSLKKLDKHISYSKSIADQLAEYMKSFEKNLSGLSIQMNNLKGQSELLNHQLSVNSKFEKKFTPIVSDFIISPDIISSITKDKVNTQWCDNLSYINLKLELYHKYQADIKEHISRKSKKEGSSAADYQDYDPRNLQKFLSEMKELIDLLILKALEKIKDFLVSKIKLIRYSRNVTLQVLQKNLLSMKEIYQFMRAYNEPLALDLRQAYILTVRWYYFRNFGKYLYSLEKLKLYNIDKNYLLGNLNNHEITAAQASNPSANTRSTATSWLSPFTSSGNASSNKNSGNLAASKKPAIISLHDFLSVNQRLDILTQDDPTVLPAQIAETNPLTYWLEAPFRSFNLAVVDNGTVEYLFLSEFFQIINPEEISTIFQEIFQNVFQVGINFTRCYLTSLNNYDFYSILICIKMCQMFLFKLQHRKIPVMENYLNLQIITLWPKYQLIIDANCSNLKKVLIKSTSSATSYFSSLRGSNNDANSARGGKSNDQSLVPHSITQQFGTLLASLLRIAAVDTSNPSLISDIHHPQLKAATPFAQDYQISKSHQKDNGEKSSGATANGATANGAVVTNAYDKSDANQSRSTLVSNATKKPFESQQTDPLSTSVIRLRNEFENVLNKLSLLVTGASTSGNSIGSSVAANKKRETFLYNNYFLLYTVTHQCEGPVAETEKEHFRLLMEAYKQSLN